MNRNIVQGRKNNLSIEIANNDVIDFEKNKCSAKFRIRNKKKNKTVTEKLENNAFLLTKNFWVSMGVSLALVLLIIATVPSFKGIMGACVAAAAILFYATSKNGSPAYREVLMLLGWAASALALNSVYPLILLKTPLGVILSGAMIASLFYLYKLKSSKT